MGTDRDEDYPILFALDEGGVLRHVDDVPNGKSCGCRCPDPTCRQQLIARNHATKMIHHFAHQRGTCKWSVENVVTLLAVECLGEFKRLNFPKLSYHDYDTGEDVVLSRSVSLEVKEARTERLSGRRAPEIVVTCTSRRGDKDFVVVMSLIHKVTDSEKEKLFSTGLDVIVVNLHKDLVSRRKALTRKDGRHYDRAELIAHYQNRDFISGVICNEGMKYWLLNGKKRQHEGESRERRDQRLAEEECARQEQIKAEEKRRAEEERRRQEHEKAKEEERARRERERKKHVLERKQRIVLRAIGRSETRLASIAEVIDQQEYSVTDENGVRWCRCERCKKVKPETEFWEYGGLNRMCLGVCKRCMTR